MSKGHCSDHEACKMNRKICSHITKCEDNLNPKECHHQDTRNLKPDELELTNRAAGDHNCKSLLSCLYNSLNRPELLVNNVLGHDSSNDKPVSYSSRFFIIGASLVMDDKQSNTRKLEN